MQRDYVNKWTGGRKNRDNYNQVEMPPVPIGGYKAGATEVKLPNQPGLFLLDASDRSRLDDTVLSIYHNDRPVIALVGPDKILFKISQTGLVFWSSETFNNSTEPAYNPLPKVVIGITNTMSYVAKLLLSIWEESRERKRLRDLVNPKDYNLAKKHFPLVSNPGEFNTVIGELMLSAYQAHNGYLREQLTRSVQNG